MAWFIGRCGVCKVAHRISPAFARERVNTGGMRVRIIHRYTIGTETINGDDSGFAARSPLCTCNREILYQRVRGKLTVEPCSIKCTGAYGPRCHCSCAGENHGAKYGGNDPSTL